MNPNFAIVLLVLLLVIIAMLVVSIIEMGKTLKKYGEVNEIFTNRQLEKIELAADETVVSLKEHAVELNKALRKDYLKHAQDFKIATSDIEKSYKKASEDLNEDILRIGKLYQDLNKTLTTNIQTFIDESKKDFVQHLTDVGVTNKSLDIEIAKMREFLVQGKEIQKNTSGVFTKIENVSDKSKELISEHLLRLDNFDKSFENELKVLKSKYDGVIKQKNSDYEVLLTKLKEAFTLTMENLVVEVNKNIDVVSTRGLAEMANVGEKNIQFISEVIESNKLPKIIEKNDEMVAHINALVRENEENMKTLINITNERYLELENKLNNRKRGLFG